MPHERFVVRSKYARHRLLAKEEVVESPELSPTPPLGSKQQFSEMLQYLVTSEAPKLFAVVLEHGDREDACIAGWGMAFADHAEVVAVDGGLRMSLRKPTSALRLFDVNSEVRPRFVWAYCRCPYPDSGCRITF
jgi:hypothetical protein